ncbi:MAG: AI-2E family transporter [Clostridia bacterium]|nr:AI-2E family transporter [Clostridia bacterium]
MKIDWNRKYTTLAVYTILTALAIILLCVMVLNFNGVKAVLKTVNGIMTPFYIGLAVAYIANPIMKMSEKHIFRFKVTTERRLNLKRGLSIALSLIVLAIILTILFLLIIPQVILSLTDLASKMSGYIEKTLAWLDSFLPDSIFDSANLSIENFFDTIMNFFTDSTLGEELSGISASLDLITNNLDSLLSNSVMILKNYLPLVFSAFAGLANGVLNIVLGIFFAIYILASKEKLIAQIKKVFRAILSEHHYNSVIEFGHFTNKTFGAYLLGKVLDSLVVGIVIFIAFAIFRIPYAPLLSVIIAITNVIPVIGPFIGAIPGVLIIFIVDPSKVLWFIVINVIIQQIDGNIIVPKILGETTGLSSLWVLFSITVFGGLWGLFGMFISVPIFAIIYMLIKLYVERRLRDKELPIATEDYYCEHEKREFVEKDDNKHSFAARIRNTTNAITKQTLGSKLKNKLKKKEKTDSDDNKSNKDN